MLKASLNMLNTLEKDVLLRLGPFFKEKGLLSGGTALIAI